MSTNSKYKNFSFRQTTTLIVGLAFFINSILPVYAQNAIGLPPVGTAVNLSATFNPAILKAVKVNPDNPFQFDFIVDQGDKNYSFEELKTESQKLIRYFLVSLTTPENDLWVNLSPYEKNRIIPESFGVTEMGRDLLAQDYLLKQITATLLYPEGEVGEKFWDKVREKALKKFGTTEVPTNTFNKVWIVPEKAVVYENGASAYVDATHLKVMLEEDYLALSKSEKMPAQSQDVNALGSQVVREIVLPELEKEVNEGTHFAALRQIYHSLILANWYKKRIKDSILAQVYVDQKKVAGVEIDDKNEAEKIYEQYITAFKEGVFNYIKEDIDPVTQESIPRKYFSGGVALTGMVGSSAIMITRQGLPTNFGGIGRLRKVTGNVIGRQRGSVEVTSGWSNYRKSNPRVSGDLAYRLDRLNSKFILPRVDDKVMIARPVGSNSQVKTIDTDETPLDLLREISYYLEDLEDQMKSYEIRSNIPTLYGKTKDIFRKIMVVAFNMDRLILKILEESLAKEVNTGLKAFMDGDNDALNAAQVRTIVEAILDSGVRVPENIVVLLREPTLIDMRYEALDLIVPAILNVAQKKQVAMNPQTAKRLAQVASHGESDLLNNALMRRNLTWSEILDQNDAIYPAVERIAALEKKIEDDLARLGESLVRLREEKGISPSEFALRSGISLEIYGLYEQGKIHRINPRHILNFANTLEVPVEELWPEEDLVQFTFAGQSKQVAASAVGFPEDVRNYDSLSPDQKALVKAKYRNQNGYLVIPYSELFASRKRLGALHLYGRLDREPLILIDPVLDSGPQHQNVKDLVVKHFEFIVSKWEEKRKELGLNNEQMAGWIDKNYFANEIFLLDQFRQVLEYGDKEEIIRRLLTEKIFISVSRDGAYVRSRVGDVLSAMGPLQEIVGKENIKRVVDFIRLVQSGGQAEAFTQEIDGQENSYIKAMKEYEEIQRVNLLAGQNKAVESNVNASSALSDPVGGIDLSAKRMMIDIRTQGAPIQFDFDAKQLKEMQFDGFVPVIINIAPVKNLPLFLTEKQNQPTNPS